MVIPNNGLFVEKQDRGKLKTKIPPLISYPKTREKGIGLWLYPYRFQSNSHHAWCNDTRTDRLEEGIGLKPLGWVAVDSDMLERPNNRIGKHYMPPWLQAASGGTRFSRGASSSSSRFVVFKNGGPFVMDICDIWSLCFSIECWMPTTLVLIFRVGRVQICLPLLSLKNQEQTNQPRRWHVYTNLYSIHGPTCCWLILDSM